MKAKDRDAELNNALLLYICQCQVNNDLRSLEKLGISEEVREMLKRMTVLEALHLCKIPLLIANISIDNSLLQNLCRHVRHESHQEEVITQLIVAGAPLKLLRVLTSIDALEFSARRKLLGIDTLGRTQDPTAEQEMLVYQHWKSFDMSTNLDCEQWLEIARITNLPIRTIYKVICEEDNSNARIA